MPGNVKAVSVEHSFNPITAIWGRYYRNFRFTDEEIWILSSRKFQAHQTHAYLLFNFF